MEVDEEIFNDDAFDCYAWIEGAVIERQGQVNELSNLLPQLNALSQTLSTSIHQTLQDLHTISPQIQQQITTIHSDIIPLSNQLNTLTYSPQRRASLVSKVSSSDSTNNIKLNEKSIEQPSSINTTIHDHQLNLLVTLHDTKQRLLACSRALVEAAKWEKNAREIFILVDNEQREQESTISPSSNVETRKRRENLAALASQMKNSLEVLKNMPGNDERERTLMTLQLDIETILMPKLRSAMSVEILVTDEVVLFVDILHAIGCSDNALLEYCKLRPADIHRLWQSKTTNENIPVHVWIENTFYPAILRLLERELVNVKEIFPQIPAVKVMVSLVHSTLHPLLSSFQELTKLDVASMQDITMIFEATCVFGEKLLKLILSIESNSNELNKYIEDLAVDLFEPHFIVLNDFEQYMTSYLTQNLENLLPKFQGEKFASDFVEDSVAKDQHYLETFALELEENSANFITQIENSFEDCIRLSCGACIIEAKSAIAKAMEKSMLTLRRTIASVRAYYQLDYDSKLLLSQSHVHIEWVMFHETLTLLKACGGLIKMIKLAEDRITVNIRDHLTALQQLLGARSTYHNTIDNIDTEKHSMKQIAILLWLQRFPSGHAKLQQFLMDYGFSSSMKINPQLTILQLAKEHLYSWTKEVQFLTYDSVFHAIKVTLKRVPHLNCWSPQEEAPMFNDLPTFSTLPQEYITTVADLLLSLLPQLEPFAESSSCRDAAIASSNASICCHREWGELAQLLELSDHERHTCEAIFHTTTSEPTEEASTGLLSATEFVDLWTNTLASGTFAQFLIVIYNIPAFTDQGLQQLLADLSYFENVLNALGGGMASDDHNFILANLRKSLGFNMDDYEAYLQKLEKDAATSQEYILLKLHTIINKKRRNFQDNNEENQLSGGSQSSINPQVPQRPSPPRRQSSPSVFF